MQETTPSKYSASGRSVESDTVLGKVHKYCSSLKSAAFALQIPPLAPASFTSDLASVQWHLDFMFVIGSGKCPKDAVPATSALDNPYTNAKALRWKLDLIVKT